MDNEEGYAKTKVVSLFARGTFEVSSPQAHARHPAHLEHVPFVSDDTFSEPLDEEGEGSDVSDQLDNAGAAEGVEQQDRE